MLMQIGSDNKRVLWSFRTGALVDIVDKRQARLCVCQRWEQRHVERPRFYESSAKTIWEVQYYVGDLVFRLVCDSLDLNNCWTDGEKLEMFAMFKNFAGSGWVAWDEIRSYLSKRVQESFQYRKSKWPRMPQHRRFTLKATRRNYATLLHWHALDGLLQFFFSIFAFWCQLYCPGCRSHVSRDCRLSP